MKNNILLKKIRIFLSLLLCAYVTTNTCTGAEEILDRGKTCITSSRSFLERYEDLFDRRLNHIWLNGNTDIGEAREIAHWIVHRKSSLQNSLQYIKVIGGNSEVTNYLKSFNFKGRGISAFRDVVTSSAGSYTSEYIDSNGYRYFLYINNASLSRVVIVQGDRNVVCAQF
jgi:hypothetical protein